MTICFGAFTLDLDARLLTRDSVPVHITPKAFEILANLVRDRPKALSKDELQKRLWPETFVAEANLSNLVAEVREALGDHARSPSFIRTAHGFGYAFCGEATVVAASKRPVDDRPTCWLQWGDRRFLLSAGDNVVGRDPDVEIRLDASTVSRRHARLAVTNEGTLLEDLGSKNGTSRGSEPVTSPVRLCDGDDVHFGSLLVTFHARAVVESTETQVSRPA